MHGMAAARRENRCTPYNTQWEWDTHRRDDRLTCQRRRHRIAERLWSNGILLLKLNCCCCSSNTLSVVGEYSNERERHHTIMWPTTKPTIREYTCFIVRSSILVSRGRVMESRIGLGRVQTSVALVHSSNQRSGRLLEQSERTSGGNNGHS